MRSFAVLFIILVCRLGFADGLPGTYVGNGHYGQIVITARGTDYLMTTCGYYQQNCFSISAELQPVDAVNFQSVNGAITVYYGQLACSYSISIHVSADGSQIYLSENGPGNVPLQWPYGYCPNQSILDYSDYVEPKAYVRQ